ncbi:MAG: 2-oxoacid:acceptor oxidoreductase family protein [Bacteroidaceae bacterium]|nr:2-oxoacid:acceptor oxidoreductase family protein [Bacteroidaceae bacterium]
MTEEIIIAGFGGQGVLSMGKIMAYSGFVQGLETTWIPSYGPEIRGGTANVTVILSDKPISSPILQNYSTAIILNQQSLDKFEETVKPGGVLLYTPSTISRKPTRTDITIYPIRAIEEAQKMNASKVANMLLLGAFMKIRPMLDLNWVMRAIKHSVSERNWKYLPLNEQAIRRGMELVDELQNQQK